MDIETMLNEEIRDEFENLKTMELGSDQYRTTVDGLTKLVDRAIDLEKISIEQSEKQKQMEEDKKNRWVQNGITIGGILIPVGVTIWGTLKTFEFEKTGSVSTIMGRGFFQKMIPKK